MLTLGFVALLFVILFVATGFAGLWAREKFNTALKRHTAIQRWQIRRLQIALKAREDQLAALTGQVEGFEGRLSLVVSPEKGKLLNATTPWGKMEDRYLQDIKADKLAVVGGLGPDKVN